MTKAMTIGARKRQKRQHSGKCQLSGVTIAAEQEARQRAAQRDIEARRGALLRRCYLMQMAPTEANLRLVDDPKIGTLYGRLYLKGRLGKSPQGADDAYDGLHEFDRLSRQYARLVLGRSIPGDAETPAAPDDLDPQALAGKWVSARGVLTLARVERAVVWCIEADQQWPSIVSEADALAISLGGLALARHFGMRA